MNQGGRYTKYALFFLAMVLLGSAGLWFYSTVTRIEEIYVLPADAYIEEDRVGFNLDKDLLHFGIVKPGTASSQRFLVLENRRKYPINVLIRARGDLEGLIITHLVSNQSMAGPLFSLGSNSTLEVVVRFIAPPAAKTGDKFFGDIQIIFTKP